MHNNFLTKVYVCLPRRPLSLALRLTLFIGLATTLVFITFGLFMVRSVEQHFAEQDAIELQSVVNDITKLMQCSCNNDEMLAQKINRMVTDHANIFIRVTNAKGIVIYATEGPDLSKIAQQVPANTQFNTDRLSIWQENIATKHPNEESSEKNHDSQPQTYRVAVITLSTTTGNVSNEYTLTAAITMDFHLHYMEQLIRSLWISTLSACVIFIMTARLAVYQGHAPLRYISERIQNITSTNLHTRIETNAVPIELEQLSLSFNKMIERIDNVFQRQSNFSADIAHELRTPITSLATQTQIVLSHPRTIEEYQEVLYSSLEDYEYMAKMISDMLFLAQADNNLLIPEITNINLTEEINAVFEYFEAWAEEREVNLQLVGEINTMILGDRLMLRRVFTNLLSNAVRYTPPKHSVSVHLTQHNNTVEILIENPGTEIPAAHLSKLFDRFYRVDPSRQRKGDGAGIGLSIVKSIIEAHGGNISASSDSLSTKFIIILPKSLLEE